ncbi:HBS1-like protein isoform X2 [Branchiostoma floridae]|uniref:HBS1-like protein n=1 Tax=Branchiostoma floridae TaxID=7739 RepID=A0A9J7HRE7_BRAFL|nr:HBS1-like protein isoform X2 [Branchiostoma floridae]
MSRHRNIRSMNVHDEYEGYDDVYGHSVEDDYGVSPATEAQFMYRRSEAPRLSSFIEESKKESIEEEEEYDYDDHEDHDHSLSDSQTFQWPRLSDQNEARLRSCLEEIQNVIGDSVPQHVLVDTVMRCDYDLEKALDAVLSIQDKPKEARPMPTAAAPPRTQGAGAGDRWQQAPAKEEAAPRVAQVSTPRRQVKTGFQPVATSSKQVTTGFQVPPADTREVIAENGLSGSTEAGEREDQQAVPTSQKAAGKTKQGVLDVAAELSKRDEGKEVINMVIIGHVDAGKSTLMGHLLYRMGHVNKKTMHKYEVESQKAGKASFAYAWVLDETGEERVRGITMDVGLTKFETDHKVVTLLDAPGHRDFIPNMITGAAQADVAILVVDASTGEFEAGFEAGGQTREHAMLVRSLGVTQLAVAINKLDTVGWSENRYQAIVKKLGHFLKQAGFKDSDVVYIPVSGLQGENLIKPASEPQLTAWYKGPCLLQQIDSFKSPSRPVDKPFRFCVSDVFKGMGSGFSVAGRLVAGSIQNSTRVMVMPVGETATVKGIAIHDFPMNWACAGDHATLTITGTDIMKVSVGSVLCDLANPILAASRIRARVIIFNIEVPITKGFPVVFHYQTLSEPANIRKLISLLHKSTGEVTRNKPRCLSKGNNAVVEVELNRPVCLELYKDNKDLGRFMLRYGSATIAAGVVTEILNDQK